MKGLMTIEEEMLCIRDAPEPTGARLQGWLSDAMGKQVHIGALHHFTEEIAEDDEQ